MTHSDAKFGKREKEREREREKKRDDHCPKNLYEAFWIKPNARSEVRVLSHLSYLLPAAIIIRNKYNSVRGRCEMKKNVSLVCALG